MASTVHKLGGCPPADWRSAGLHYCDFNFWCRTRFGGKVWKVSVDAGCDCPNRDGTLSTSGCVFCDIPSFSPSRRGLSPSAHRPSVKTGTGSATASTVADADASSIAVPVPVFTPPIRIQLREGMRRLKDRHAAERFIAYFQPGTNTYGPIDRLRRSFQEAAEEPGVVGLAIGTRPDCVGDAMLDMLADVSQRTWLIIEFGVQTIHNRTLDRLNRGHHFDAFCDAYRRASARGLNMAGHVILGLPGESDADMLATAHDLARFRLHSIKLHNLYAVRGTHLAAQVAAGEVRLPEFEEHVGRVVDFLEETPGECVVDRISGDAPAEFLLGPEWCRNKAVIRAAVDAEFRHRGTWQGCKLGIRK
jgi:uncharacterized protein